MRYYANIRRSAVYRIDEELNGYYINEKEKDWVESQDVLRVPHDTTHFDEISKQEAYSIIVGWK